MPETETSISGQVSSVENLPTVEMATDAAAAAATAGEALLQVKAQEVATLAEVLTRLNEKEAQQDALVGRMEAATVAIETMKLEIQETLAAIRAQKEQAAVEAAAPKAPASPPVKGLGNLLVRR